MTITLPDELTEPLSWIGLEWPEADEDQLAADGRTWIDHGTRMRAHADQANAAARDVWLSNEGATVEAFERWWNGADGPGRHLADAATASELIGGALIAMAGVTIGLKAAFIAQLTALAFEVGQAIATATVTAGATLAEIPVWIALTRVAIKKLIHEAMALIEREIAVMLRRAARLLEKAGARELAKTTMNGSRKTAFKGLMHEVENANVRSPFNGANFYSGRQPSDTAMRDYAEKQVDGVRSVTLEMTPDGRRFDDMRLFDNGSPVNSDQAIDIWRRLSERYAQDASGEATAWTHNALSSSVWNTREKPALLVNPNVTKINEIDPF
jgi:transposase InsO family protein